MLVPSDPHAPPNANLQRHLTWLECHEGVDVSRREGAIQYCNEWRWLEKYTHCL